MLGYIYVITNKISGKKYVGQTTNFFQRKECHLSNLRVGKHHSQKLQNAYNKYGEENFIWSYEICEVDSIEDLYILEQKKIQELDSYNNGYNCTLGGEGSKTLFDYNTSCLLYNILQKYEGVSRQIARYYNCDHAAILNIKNNEIFGKEEINKNQLEQLIKELNLKDSNLKENYQPHNNKKLSKTQCFEILSIILLEDGFDRLIADVYNIHVKEITRLKNKEIYKDYIEEFNKLLDIEKQKINNYVKEKYDLEHLRLMRKRGNVKSALTQDQVNYIMSNKDSKKQIEIAKDLNISRDRVRSVIKGISYKDLVKKYYETIK